MTTQSSLIRLASLTRNDATLALDRVKQIEKERERARANGCPIGEVDGRLAAARTVAAGALLGASKAARDAGDTTSALELIDAYAHQEYMASSLRERLTSASR